MQIKKNEKTIEKAKCLIRFYFENKLRQIKIKLKAKEKIKVNLKLNDVVV